MKKFVFNFRSKEAKKLKSPKKILGGKGLGFIFLPVAIGAIIIVIFANIYNKMIGKKYPI